jgi:hypothetical protein
MIDAEMHRRVERLLRGDRRVDDLDRIFLGLRDRAHGRASVREIGDFVAHRGERDKGPVTSRVRDIFISLHSWAGGLLGRVPTLEQARKVAGANLRIATDAQLQHRLALRRTVVASVLEQGFRKLEQGRQLTERERRVVNYLSSAFIWNQVFTDGEVEADLAFVLERLKLLKNDERARLHALAPFLALYVITLLHGSAIRLDELGRAELFANYRNDQQRLEVKATLIITDIGKPIIAPVCIFWTGLSAADWCHPSLLASPEVWEGPLEIDETGLLAGMR